MRLKIKKPFILWNESRGAAAARGLQQSLFQLVDIGLGMSLRRIQFYSFHFFFFTHTSYVPFTLYSLVCLTEYW